MPSLPHTHRVAPGVLCERVVPKFSKLARASETNQIRLVFWPRIGGLTGASEAHGQPYDRPICTSSDSSYLLRPEPFC
jgi:hypothetical protein